MQPNIVCFFSYLVIMDSKHCVAPSGHAPGIPSPGEGASPCTPPNFTGASVKAEKEPGLSGYFCSWTACESSTTQGLPSLNTFPRQHELTQQCWQPVTQTYAQEWTGNKHTPQYWFTYIHETLDVGTGMAATEGFTWREEESHQLV